MDYSTVLMLDYLEDTLTNVELPEVLLECDSNNVTQINNKCVKRDYNQIGGKPSQIK